MHVGGEGSHDDAIFSIAELVIKGLAHHLLAGSEAGALCIGAVG